MQKKYQIFVSSTFRDLVEERQDTIRHILDLGHIPAGMELFPAADTEQLEYIKKIIDECDYYILIIGGRYGSMDDEGVSFTDREYEYALDTGKPVLAFIHGDPGKISVENSDIDPRISARLKEFKDRVSTGRLVKFWSTRESLALAVLKALVKTIQDYPQTGWIRGNAAASEDILQKMNNLRNENDELVKKIRILENSQKPKIDGLAGLEEKFSIRYTTSISTRHGQDEKDHVLQLSWGNIFSIVGPSIISPSQPTIIKSAIKKFIQDEVNSHYSVDIFSADIDTIKLHLLALNVIAVYKANSVKGGLSEYVEITDHGKSTLIGLKAVKSKT